MIMKYKRFCCYFDDDFFHSAALRFLTYHVDIAFLVWYNKYYSSFAPSCHKTKPRQLEYNNENLSTQDIARIFSSNFADYCVKFFWLALVGLRNFVLSSAKFARKSTHKSCEDRFWEYSGFLLYRKAAFLEVFIYYLKPPVSFYSARCSQRL